MSYSTTELLVKHLTCESPQLSAAQLQSISPYLDFVSSFLGKLFIMGYRHTLTLCNTLIFTKTISKQFTYILLMITRSSPSTHHEMSTTIQKVTIQIKKLCATPIIEVIQLCISSFHVFRCTSPPAQSLAACNYLTNTPSTITLFGPAPKLPLSSFPRLHELTESNVQYLQFSKVINDYLDRYGKQEPYLLKQYFSTHDSYLIYDVEYIFRTVDLILYKELRGSQYTQIESEEWSVFTDGVGFVHHRRHTTLRGEGRILILYWIFREKFWEDYLTEGELEEMRKVWSCYGAKYGEVRIKVVRVWNRLEEGVEGVVGVGMGIRYKYEEWEVKGELIGEMMEERRDKKKWRRRYRKRKVVGEDGEGGDEENGIMIEDD